MVLLSRFLMLFGSALRLTLRVSYRVDIFFNNYIQLLMGQWTGVGVDVFLGNLSMDEWRVVDDKMCGLMILRVVE